MAKLKETGKLAGIANVIPHQFIISDLIFGIRKRFAKNKKASSYRVISEISLSEIGTIYNDKKFTKNHNIDLVIIDAKSRDIVFIIEIERTGKSRKITENKMLECLTNIPTIQEAFIITIGVNSKPTFEKVELERKKLVFKATTSKCEFIDYILATSFISY